MKPASRLAREEPASLGDVRNVTDQERAAGREKLRGRVEEAKHASIGKDVVQNAVGDDGVDPAPELVQELRRLGEAPRVLPQARAIRVVPKHLLRIDEEQLVLVAGAQLVEHARQIAATRPYVQHGP